jgi:ketosteroid isomerase-like protein
MLHWTLNLQYRKEPGMTQEPVQIVRAVYDAYVRKDRRAIESLIAEDFHFTSPLDNRLDRKTYLERCWPNSETTAGFEFRNLVSDGDRVFVTYVLTKATGDRFCNTEILLTRNGKVAAIEVYFGWMIPHEAPAGSFVNPK